jgi:hypothetical protein
MFRNQPITQPELSNEAEYIVCFAINLLHTKTIVPLFQRGIEGDFQ